jgi:hypothetical protein
MLSPDTTVGASIKSQSENSVSPPLNLAPSAVEGGVIVTTIAATRIAAIEITFAVVAVTMVLFFLILLRFIISLDAKHGYCG